MRLDHLAIAAETLEEGVAWAEQKFGVPFLAGGKHAHFGTHNRLLGLAGGIYLEVIAVDPDGVSEGPRWFGLDEFKGPPRLANWICEPEDFNALLMHGMRPVAMQRGELKWDMGVPPDGVLPMGGGFPTVLRWHTDTPPGVMLEPSGFELTSLTIQHPSAKGIAAQLTAILKDDRIEFHESDEISLSASFTGHDWRVDL